MTVTGQLPLYAFAVCQREFTMSTQYECCMLIQDIIGPATLWPRAVRQYFWAPHLNHWQRIRLAAFIWVNGLNPEVYYDWCDVRRRMMRGSAEYRHIQQLVHYFEIGRQYRLWSWNVYNGRYEWLDGTPRLTSRR
jgi:hypothetical protein